MVKLLALFLIEYEIIVDLRCVRKTINNMEKLTHQEEELLLVIYQQRIYTRFHRANARAATTVYHGCFYHEKPGTKRIRELT